MCDALGQRRRASEGAGILGELQCDDGEGQRMADVSIAQSVNETLAGGLYSANTAYNRERGLLRQMSDPALRRLLSCPSPHPTKPGGTTTTRIGVTRGKLRGNSTMDAVVAQSVCAGWVYSVQRLARLALTIRTAPLNFAFI